MQLPHGLGLIACCLVRRFDAEVNSLEDLRRLMTYSRRFVQTIRLRQLPSHLDLTMMFDCMVK